VKIYLVRHGQTIWNRDHLFQGQSDVDLTALGKEQSLQVGIAISQINPCKLYSSPLARTKYIAEIASQRTEAKIELLNEMKELDLGDLEGKTGVELRNNWPHIIDDWRETPSTIIMPNGESFSDLHDRTTRCFYELEQLEECEVMVIVTHNFVIKSLVCEILGLTMDSLHKINIDLGSISRIDIDGENRSIGLLNNVSHLDGLGE
jgi:broad specificity phosphatase PhoE